MNVERAQKPLSLERLWQFSLQYYSVSDVKEACLTVQNQYHGNVNLLLLLRWLDEQQLSFPINDWHTVQHSIVNTEMQLHNYRELRRQFKRHLPDSLYRKALQFELQLEKQQQADLVYCINHLELSHNNQESLVLHYCHLLGAEDIYPAFLHSV